MSSTLHPGWCREARPKRRVNVKADLVAADAIEPPPVPEGDPLADLGVVHQRVARLIGYGLTNPQIGGVMGISEETVRHHCSTIYRTLKIEGMNGVSSRRLAFLIGYHAAMVERRKRTE